MTEQMKISLENVRNSAKKDLHMTIDESSIYILDDEAATWIARVTMDNVSMFIFVRHLAIIFITEIAKESLIDWALEQ